MHKYTKLRQLLSIVLMIMLLFTTALPVMASSTTETSAQTSTQTSAVQNVNTLTVPLKLDGSKPSKSEAVVKNASSSSSINMMNSFSAASTAEPDFGLPKKVETSMTAVEAGIPENIKIITADKYFLYTPYGETSPIKQFYAEVDGFIEDIDYQYNGYFIRISTSDTDETQPHIDSTLHCYGDKWSMDTVDISGILGDSTARQVYISIWDKGENPQTESAKRLCGPVQIQVNYVNDIASVESQYRYIYKDKMYEDDISFHIPGVDRKLNSYQNPEVTLELINSSGQVVAKNVEELSGNVWYLENVYYYGDYRYDSIFQFNWDHLKMSGGEIEANLYRAAEFTPGIYGLRVKYVDGTHTDYNNLIQIVDGAIIKEFGYSRGNDFPPPVVGGNEAYITLYAQNANKDDFEVSIIDEDGNVIGISEASRYIEDYERPILYKVRLKDGILFEEEKGYRIQLTCSSGKIYYSGDNNTPGLYPEKEFHIYGYSFNKGQNLADFTLKAANIPENPTPITLELYGNKRNDIYGYNEYGYISSVQVTPSTTMQVKFADYTGRALSLSQGQYEIKQLVGQNEWFTHLRLYVEGTYTPTLNKGYEIENPYFYLTDTAYDFEVALSKEKYNITQSSTYKASLKNSVGQAVYESVYGDDLKVEDTSINSWNELGTYTTTPAVKLSGKIPLKGDLKEGTYTLNININNGSQYYTTNVILDVSALEREKVYASLSYNEILAGINPRISGDTYMLKREGGYDSSKFEYEITDLFGNQIATGPLNITHYTSSGYDEHYEINADIEGAIPAAYYFLKLKYDGKDLYNLKTPSQLVFYPYVSLNKGYDKPEFYGQSYDNDMIDSIFLRGNVEQGSNITALLYDAANKYNFEPVMTVSLQEDPQNPGRYVFTAPMEIDSTKLYDAAILFNGISIGYIANESFKAQNIQSVAVTGISLDQSSLSVNVDETKQLTAIVSPSNATNKKVIWTSDRETVAAVDSYGRVKGVAAGTATITATTQEGNFIAQSIVTVTVPETPVAVTGVSLNRKTISLIAGGTATLNATVQPSNAANKNISWSSDKTVVASVYDNNGIVKAVGAGIAVITATTEDGGKTASCTVNVGVNVNGKLKYGEEAAQYTWVSLYKGTTYVNGKYTDASGNFYFGNIPAGDYNLQAYSSNMKYKALNYNFTIAEGETAKDLSTVNFESKYPNATHLTVNVANGSGDALGSSFNIYVYNYETGISEWKTSDGSTKSISISDLPYDITGSNYYVYLYTGEATDYYYSSTVLNINGTTASVNFNVPITYKISGTVKDNDGLPVQYTSLTAAKDGILYYGYTDDKGVYTIRGLGNGTYSLTVNNSKYFADVVSVTINNASVTSGADITVQKGLTLIGKVLKGSVPAYKAYVYLTDNAGNWITSAYSTGEGGFVLDGAIKKTGTYKLSISGIYNQNGTWSNFVSTPVTFEVTASDISSGRVSKDIPYQDPTNASDVFAGSGNMVLTDVSIVRSGSSVNLIVKYKNNGINKVSATFKAMLPEGVAVSGSGSNTFEATNLESGASGQKSIALEIGNTSTNYLTVPVKVSIGNTEYDFGTANIEVANVTLSGPGAVKTTDGFKVYGEATANSSIVIKNSTTGEVLGSAKPNGRWYSAELKPLSEGPYKLVAEATSGEVKAVSEMLEIESRADQITVDSVSANSLDSADLPVNKLIGVRAFTAWVGPDLSGRDINLGVKFGNDSTINSVTYHFSSKDYTAARDSNGRWNANLTGWSGGGLKTITATVKTSDNRTLTFIIAEVTVLIDPSGYIKDDETGNRLSGVTVICEVLNGDVWEKWDAERYGQINPQVSDASGNYGWMVPEGTYRVRALKNGYAPYVTTDDPAFSDNGNSTIVIPPVRTDVNFMLTPYILVESIILDKADISIEAGSKETLNAYVTPEDATNAANVEWTSSNTSVATVEDGVVTAVNKGTAIITAKAGSKTVTCEVTVSGEGTIPVEPETPQHRTTRSISVVSSAVTPTASAVDINPSIAADDSGKANLKYEQLDKADSLTIKAAATITFDKVAIASIKSSAGDTTIAVTKVDASTLSEEARSVIGQRPVFEFKVTTAGKSVSDFDGGMVKVDIPYSAEADEDINAIVLYYIDSDGKLNVLRDSVYDPETKSISFVTSHFSKYAIGYNKKEFSDVSGWAADYITYLSARGIINGVGDGKYEPESNISRADFALILAKIAGSDLNIYSSSRFSDISSNDYFAKAVEWAADKGIVNGVGDNKYSPYTYITRQDMARMIVNFAKAMNYELSREVPATGFADQPEISSYAADAAKAVQQAGIISGKTYGDRFGSFFAPKDNATRAEAAKMLTVLLQGMMK